jgi:hypothetical protein
MNASAAIADVRARGVGPEAKGYQWECRFSRLVPLAPHLASMRFFEESS